MKNALNQFMNTTHPIPPIPLKIRSLMSFFKFYNYVQYHTSNEKTKKPLDDRKNCILQFEGTDDSGKTSIAKCSDLVFIHRQVQKNLSKRLPLITKRYVPTT